MYRLTGKGIYPPPVGFSVDIDGTMRYFDAQAQEVDMDGARVPSTRSWGIPTFGTNTDPYHKAILTRKVSNAPPANRMCITITTEEWIISGCTRENVAKCIFDMSTSPRYMMGIAYESSTSTITCEKYLQNTFATGRISNTGIHSFFAYIQETGILYALCQAFPAHNTSGTLTPYKFQEIVESDADTDMAKMVFIFIMHSTFGDNAINTFNKKYIQLLKNVNSLKSEIDKQSNTKNGLLTTLNKLTMEYKTIQNHVPVYDPINEELTDLQNRISAYTIPTPPTPVAPPTTTPKITAILGSIVSYTNAMGKDAALRQSILDTIKKDLKAYTDSATSKTLKDDADNIFDVLEQAASANIDSTVNELKRKSEAVPVVKTRLSELARMKKEKADAGTKLQQAKTKLQAAEEQLTEATNAATNAATAAKEAADALTKVKNKEALLKTNMDQLLVAYNTKASELSSAQTDKESASNDAHAAANSLMVATAQLGTINTEIETKEKDIENKENNQDVKDAYAAQNNFDTAKQAAETKRTEAANASAPQGSQLDKDAENLENIQKKAKTTLDAANKKCEAELKLISYIKAEIDALKNQITTLDVTSKQNTQTDTQTLLNNKIDKLNSIESETTQAKQAYDNAVSSYTDAQSTTATAETKKTQAVAYAQQCTQEVQTATSSRDTAKTDLTQQQAAYDAQYGATYDWIDADINRFQLNDTIVRLKTNHLQEFKVTSVSKKQFNVNNRKNNPLKPENYQMRKDTAGPAASTGP